MSGRAVSVLRIFSTQFDGVFIFHTKNVMEETYSVDERFILNIFSIGFSLISTNNLLLEGNISQYRFHYQRPFNHMFYKFGLCVQ